jgi:Family of unknown function (DUF6311)
MCQLLAGKVQMQKRMRMHWLGNMRHQYVFGAMVGAAFFVWLYPLSILNPTHYLWLMQGDGAQHFLGWHFYRGDAWQFPIGLNRQYGQAMGSAIVFSDSIPLFALLFKPFDSLLPQHFQYTGLWMLLCTVMQGSVAWKIGEALHCNLTTKFCLTFMLVTATVLVERAWGHFALMGHWLLLAAVYAYITRQSAWRWALLIAITALVHAYLLYMVLAVWAADWLRNVVVDRAIKWPRALMHAALTLGALALVMWQIGYFAVDVGDSASGTQYGNYAAGLHSLWNPGWGSRLLPPIAVRAGTEMEGGAYLGAGGLLAVIVALSVLILAKLKIAKSIWPLVGVTLICAALALSNRVYYGTQEIFSFALPTLLAGKLDFIRGSGRLLWLLFYVLLIGSFALLARALSPFKCSVAALLICVVQVIDLGGRADTFRGLYLRHLEANARGADVLQSAFWHDPRLQKYRHVIVLPTLHMAPRFAALGMFAADHKMSINVGYFARVPMACFADGRAAEDAFRQGKFRAHTLYVIQNASIKVESSARRAQDGVGEIDGMTVVAPGWFADDNSGGGGNWLQPMAAQ